MASSSDHVSVRSSRSVRRSCTTWALQNARLLGKFVGDFEEGLVLRLMHRTPAVPPLLSAKSHPRVESRLHPVWPLECDESQAQHENRTIRDDSSKFYTNISNSYHTEKLTRF